MNSDPQRRRRPRDGRTSSTPHSEDAEKGLICSLLLAPGPVMALCHRRISANSFFIPAHAIVFDTISEWLKPDSPIDFIWLCNTLTARNKLAEVGDKLALNELYGFVPTAANPEYYIKIVAEKCALRQTLQTCRRTIDQCLDHDADPHVILKQAERSIQEIAHEQNGEVPIYREVDLAKLSDGDDEPVPEFPLATLPDRLRLLIEEVMRHYRVPALLPAVCALAINSAALGRGVHARSNTRRTYANLYALIGAESGTGKSVVFDEFVAPLTEMQHEALRAFGTEQKPRTEAELKLLDHEIHELTKFKKIERKSDISEDCRQEKLSELLQQKAELEDKLQFAARLYCEDFTSEALGMLLAASGEQVAVLSDEGGLALYNMLGRYTKGDITDDILLVRGKTCNSHTVDRVGRLPIFLRCPCITLLLLVQPDLLGRAFGSERLMIGGFLARCLAVDSKMKVQYQTEHSLPEVEENIKAPWDSHIRGLVKTFRFANESYEIPVEPEVRKLSLQYSHGIVDEVHGTLADVSSFVMRWEENTWCIALNLHMGCYGAEWMDEPRSLSAETFKKAITVSRYFAERQLEVLQRPRIQARDEQCDRLKEVFAKNGGKPISVRDLNRRHALDHEQVVSIVKNHPDLFGIVETRPPHGGRKSILVFLKSNPPPGWKASATAPRAD